MSQEEMNIPVRAVVIAGVQKCGTTSLYEMLIRHSDMAPPRYKEPSFFIHERKTVEKYLPRYTGLFKGDRGKIFIDASTSYFSSQRAPVFINEIIEDPRIIIILRDPAKRAYSGFTQMVKRGKDKRTFSEIVNDLQGCDAGNITDKEDQELQKAAYQGLVDSDYMNSSYLDPVYGPDFEPTFEDKLWLFRYFKESLYSQKVEYFKKIFKDKMKIIFFEELLSDPETVMRQIIDFIGVELEEEIFELPRSNVTTLPKNQLGTLIRRKITERKLVRDYLKKVKESETRWVQMIRRFLSNSFYMRPVITEEVYKKTREILREEYQYWFARHSRLEKYWRY